MKISFFKQNWPMLLIILVHVLTFLTFDSLEIHKLFFPVMLVAGLLILLSWAWIIKEKMWRKSTFIKVSALIMASIYLMGILISVLDTGGYCVIRNNIQSCFYDDSILEIFITGGDRPLFQRVLGTIIFVPILPMVGLGHPLYDLFDPNYRIIFLWDEKPPIHTRL